MLGPRMVPFGLGSRFFAMIQVKRTLVRSTNCQPEKGSIMSCRTLISLTASAIVGIACHCDYFN